MLPNTCLSKCKHREKTYIKLKWIELSYMGLGYIEEWFLYRGLVNFLDLGYKSSILEPKNKVQIIELQQLIHAQCLIYFFIQIWNTDGWKNHDYFHTFHVVYIHSFMLTSLKVSRSCSTNRHYTFKSSPHSVHLISNKDHITLELKGPPPVIYNHVIGRKGGQRRSKFT